MCIPNSLGRIHTERERVRERERQRDGWKEGREDDQTGVMVEV